MCENRCLMRLPLLLLIATAAVAQDIPTFQVDKCSRESPVFKGDVAEVTGRAVNPGKVHWQTAKFKATVHMVNKEDPTKVVQKTGTVEVERLEVGKSLPATVFMLSGDPLYGFKAESCGVDFVGGDRIIITDKLTTDPGLEAVFIAADKACLVDYLKATQLEGFALRKQMTELSTYGCVKVLRKGYLVEVTSKSVVTVNGRQVTVADAVFIANRALTALGQKIEPFAVSGFIPMSQLKTAPVYVLETVPPK
jgi:hypothetical protein